MRDPFAIQLKNLREPKRLYGAVLFLRRRGHKVSRVRADRHDFDESVVSSAWLLGCAVAEGYQRPSHPALRDRSGKWIVCPFCGRPEPELRVHGHVQCRHCGGVIERCCDV